MQPQSNTQLPTTPCTIYTRMVADLFHPGHVAFLKAARALGDRLIVYVLDDDFVSMIKRPPIMSQSERIVVVGACRYVDEVHSIGPKKINREFMHEQNFAIYAMGYANECEAVRKHSNCKDLPEHMVAVIPYTTDISSTILRSRVLDRHATT